MTTLGCAVIVRDFGLLDRAVASILPWVDRLTVGVDDRADPGVGAWLAARGIDAFGFAFEGFAAAFDLAAHRAGTDWVFHLDSDEAIDPLAGSLLRVLADRGARLGLDAYLTPRRHWWDLGRAREHRAPWPDWQVKLRRRGCRFRWRVHQEISPGSAVARDWGPVVEHYNFALRDAASWDAANRAYGQLLRADIADGRVWSGDPGAPLA